MANSKKPTQTDYEVGYGKPPKATRFAKGQSGNPKGRPKGKRNWATQLNSILEQKVIVNEGGKKREVTKFVAAMMQLANKAAVGDERSIRLLIQIVPGMEAMLNQEVSTSLSQAQDQKVLAELFKRMQVPDVEVISVPESAAKESQDE